MNGASDIRKVLGGVAGVVVLVMAATSGCVLFEDERTSKGRKLYRHYCMHCHGETGQQAEGFNWGRMPDPRPRDLSEPASMSTFTDEEIFNTISRDMRDTSLQAVLDDEEYFAVATMPTFRHTLSENELWAVVGYVRTLHGGSLTFDVEGRRAQLESQFHKAQAAHDQASQVMDDALTKQEAAEDSAEEARGDDVDDEDEDYEDVVLPEEEAYEREEERFAVARTAWENFSKRPRMNHLARPDLAMTNAARRMLAKEGENLYFNQYGCNGCHSIGDVGGLVGPALDRAGFRLNDTWVYRWIRYPQGMKKHTRMPNLGLNDHDAKAVTAYLETLRAPKPDKPVPLPE